MRFSEESVVFKFSQIALQTLAAFEKQDNDRSIFVFTWKGLLRKTEDQYTFTFPIMELLEKIDMYVVENKKEDQTEVVKLLDRLQKKYKMDSKKVRRDILDNIVNSKYSKVSNAFVDMIWVEFEKRYPS